MKAKIILILLIAIRGVGVYGQEVSIAKVFRFNNPIMYYTEWNRLEGSPPGFVFFKFTTEGNLFVIDTGMSVWKIYNSEMEEQSNIEINSLWNPVRGVNGKYFYIGIYSGSGGWVRIYDEEKSLTTPVYIFETPIGLKGRDVLSGSIPPYITGNMFFWETANSNLVSWELLEGGQTKYRGIEETQQWLAEGNAEKVGFHHSGSLIKFGDFYISSYVPLIGEATRIFPEGTDKQLITRMNVGYLGTDNRGLNYYRFLKTTDNLLEVFPDINTQVKVVLAIEDTWTGKVIIREYSEGTWDPPRRDHDGSVEVIGLYPWAVHPNGDVYFWDADTGKEEYQLKRLENDWWEELGITERKIGRIKENYIPLRMAAAINSQNNGYNYENEYVWIKEEREDGWVKIEKIDGREGWVEGSSIYYDQW